MSQPKEPRFFITDGGPSPYRTHPTASVIANWYEYLTIFDKATDQRARGEASIIYLSSYYPERTAARIRHRLPDVRLIAVLRQPAERAYSAFTYFRSRNLEMSPTFEAALAAEPARIQAEDWPDLRYRLNGCYHANLTPFYAQFPEQQIRVYLYEDWNERPAAVLKDIFRFLGVDDQVTIQPQRKTVTRYSRSQRMAQILTQWKMVQRWPVTMVPATWRHRGYNYLKRVNQVKPPPMSPHIRRSLTESYSDDILQLQTLLDRDLSHWLA